MINLQPQLVVSSPNRRSVYYPVQRATIGGLGFINAVAAVDRVLSFTDPEGVNFIIPYQTQIQKITIQFEANTSVLAANSLTGQNNYLDIAPLRWGAYGTSANSLQLNGVPYSIDFTSKIAIIEQSGDIKSLIWRNISTVLHYSPNFNTAFFTTAGGPTDSIVLDLRVTVFQEYGAN